MVKIALLELAINDPEFVLKMLQDDYDVMTNVILYNFHDCFKIRFFYLITRHIWNCFRYTSFWV